MGRKSHSPPWLGEKIIKLLLPEPDRNSLMGDYEELFADMAEEKGRPVANFWYGSQTMTAAAALIWKSIQWRNTMIRNYFKIIFRNLFRHKGYSFINIGGLAIGLAAFILIALFIQNELSFDRFHEKADRIYRVIREGKAVTPLGLAPALKEELPEIECAVRIIKEGSNVISRGADHFMEEKFFWADPELFDIYSIPLLKGDVRSGFKNPSDLFISEKVARKYFGDKEAIGEVLNLGGSRDFIVSGVFREMPANSHFVMEFIAPFQMNPKIKEDIHYYWWSNYVYTYYLMREGTDPVELEKKIQSVIDTKIYETVPPEVLSQVPKPYPRYFFPQQLKEIHLHSNLIMEIEPNGDIRTVILFSTIACLILFIACINYVNMTTAQSGKRAKEVGLRKVVGAPRKQLFSQFIMESFALVGVSMAISLVIVAIALPYLGNLLERKLALDLLHNPQIGLGMLLLLIFVGFFAGAFPALNLSRFKPIAVLKGSLLKGKSGSWLRNGLVILQFAITIMLITCTLDVNRQLRFIKNVDMGFNREQILVVPIRGSSVRRNMEAIRTELMRNETINGVSFSFRLPDKIETNTSMEWPGMERPEEDIRINYSSSDYDFADLFGIEIVEGRNFSREFPSDQNGAFLVNETAVKAAGWKNPIGHELMHWDDRVGKVVGVMKDFHFQSLHNPIRPLYILLDPGSSIYLSVKIKMMDVPGTIEDVKKTLQTFAPELPFEYSFFDDILDRQYRTEQRMGMIFIAFSILAIVIACLGLLGLASFSAQQRTKEIGIRKVLGAPVSKIYSILSAEFLRWVLVSNLIAWPAAYFFLRQWLQNFAYRISLGVVTFLLSGLIALLIAMITVSYHTGRAATANPIGALRYE